MNHKQLSASERQQIYTLRFQQQWTLQAIAEKLSRPKCTISREIKRNTHQGQYLPDTAQQLSEQRRATSKHPFLKVSSEMLLGLKQALADYYSPEQITGSFRKAGKACVSHETIYRMIYQDHAGLREYQKYLRQGRPKRQKRGGVKTKRGQIPNRKDIDERPAIAAQKVEIGHWEGDTVIGANHLGGLVTLVDKHSRYALVGLIKNREASHVRAVAEKLLLSVPPEYRKTVTFDNGKEFTQHEKLTEATGAECYFAKPYHSWERGLNEHTNGLIRQFFPKGTNFLIVKPAQVVRVMKLLNERPRKVLEYCTPQEVFWGQSDPVAFQS